MTKETVIPILHSTILILLVQIKSWLFKVLAPGVRVIVAQIKYTQHFKLCIMYTTEQNEVKLTNYAAHVLDAENQLLCN